MKRQGIPRDIDARSNYLQSIFCRLGLQSNPVTGKKMGRAFMMRLQQAVACEQIPYSQELVHEIIQEVGADLEMFLEDRPSDFVKEMFQTDQDTARDMGITQHPAEVVYNFASQRDYGVLLEGEACVTDLPKLCQSDAYRLPLFQLASHVAKPKKQQL